jgi:hypothetical protein
VEDALALLLLALDVLPARPHLARRVGHRLAEDVRMPAHELRVNGPRHLLEIASALFLKR